MRVAREYGNSQTKVIFDPRPNYPLSVLIGEAVYPEIEAIVKELRYLCGSVQVLEATRLAQEAGNAQAANILLMGALTAMPEIPLQAEDYSQVLSQRFKGDVYDLNQKVFDLGYKQIAV